MGIRYIFFHDYEWESGRTNDRNIIVILFRKFDLVHHRYVSRFRFRARTRRVATWRLRGGYVADPGEGAKRVFGRGGPAADGSFGSARPREYRGWRRKG